jgi:hypothetical protein
MEKNRWGRWDTMGIDLIKYPLGCRKKVARLIDVIILLVSIELIFIK